MADVLTRFGVTYAEVPLPQTLTDGNGDSLANDIALDTGVNTLVLEVTEEQYVNLLSAALNGANRYFPDNYIAVIYPLIKAAKMSNALCDAVAACIANSESETYSALNDWMLAQLQDNTDIINAISGIGNIDGTAIPGANQQLYADCDLDNLFGFCRQMVQLMNLEVEQFFEVLEVISNNVEFAAYVGDEAPALSTVATFISYLQNTLVESYLANYDIDYENDLACELFCFAQDQPDCELKWADITQIMADRVSEDLTNLSLSDLLTYVLSGGWSGDEFCDASILVFAFLMQIGADWAGITFAKIQQIMTSFFNDPDSDWMTLCGCGYLYVYEYDQAYQNGFTPTQGTWATSTALYSTTSAPYGITIEQTYGSPFDGLKKIAIYTKWSGTGSPQVALTLTHAGGTDNLSMAVANNSWREFTLPATRNGVSYIKFHTTTADGISVAYDQIRMDGIGNNPPPDPVNPP